MRQDLQIQLGIGVISQGNKIIIRMMIMKAEDEDKIKWHGQVKKNSLLNINLIRIETKPEI